MLDELACTEKVVGVKQSKRALREGRAGKLFLADDADPLVLAPLEALCAENGIESERGYTMAQLGAAAGISVGAAVVALLRKQ